MSICRIYRMPEGTLEAYDQVTAAASDVIAAGATVHLAGRDQSDLWVIEVWEDRETLEAFLSSQPVASDLEAQLLPTPEVIEFDIHRFLTG